jgi:hypothetical protein
MTVKRALKKPSRPLKCCRKLSKDYSGAAYIAVPLPSLSHEYYTSPLAPFSSPHIFITQLITYSMIVMIEQL